MKGPSGSVRVDCAACGFHLGFLALAGETVLNVDPREQPAAARLAKPLGANAWLSNCKCGAKDLVREDSLARLIPAVLAAGLTAMPFKAPVKLK